MKKLAPTMKTMCSHPATDATLKWQAVLRIPANREAGELAST